MLKGVTLQLYVGALVPMAPAPRVVVEALTSVTVTTKDVGQSGFELVFMVSTKSPLHTLFLLSGGSGVSILRIVIVVIFNGTPHVIMDGVATKHEIRPSEQAGYATLSVTGEDLSALMDLIDFSGFPFPSTPAEGRVALLLLKYAVLGIVPVIVPSILIDVDIPTKRIPSQRSTDLSYIRALADDVGYVFYLDPDLVPGQGAAPGVNAAYWGPQIKVGLPQPALNTNMDAHTNVESLSFSFNSHQNAIPTVYHYDETTHATITIPIPPITPLSPPLGLIPPIPMRLAPVSDDLAKRSLAQGIMIGLAKAAAWAEVVTGTGELNVVRYGSILKARQLVGVRGAGLAFDGLYYVKSVTHKIKRGEYKQSFELSRNGLMSTLPRLPV